jgi:glycosyltransferase involved in cell wall biosynthesis
MSTPLLTIGLPVWNGERFIEEAIESHLAQTFEDFELVISDNDSTDRTEAICRSFEARDPRVRYVRQPTNLGAARNYDFTLHHARGTYFKWSAHDDRLLPTFLAECVALLDRDPSTVLAHSLIRIIDEDGRTIGHHRRRWRRLGDGRPAVRFHDLVCSSVGPFEIFGVVRRDRLLETKGHGNWYASDRNLIAELALRGPFACVDEVLFERRQHDDAYSERPRSAEETAHWLDTSGTGDASSDRLLDEYRESLRRVHLTDAERRTCERVLRVNRPIWMTVFGTERLLRTTILSWLPPRAADRARSAKRAVRARLAVLSERPRHRGRSA